MTSIIWEIFIPSLICDNFRQLFDKFRIAMILVIFKAQGIVKFENIRNACWNVYAHNIFNFPC
jgi:hypothetical protein